MEDIARKKPTFALHAQVINEVSPGKLYLRAGQLDEASDQMREVVIYDLGDPARRRHHLRRQRHHGADPGRRPGADAVSTAPCRICRKQVPPSCSGSTTSENHIRVPGRRQHAHPLDQRHVQERARDVVLRDAALSGCRGARRRQIRQELTTCPGQRRSHRADRHRGSRSRRHRVRRTIRCTSVGAWAGCTATSSPS